MAFTVSASPDLQVVPVATVSAPDSAVRRRYVVGAVKIPYSDRDVAHAVLTPADDRGFFNIIGADDDAATGHTQPVGADVTYRVELTDDEAETFRAASNCRYVELDGVCRDGVGSTPIPAAASMQFMRAAFTGVDFYHGRDTIIGLLDGGTTTAVRQYLDVTMVARQVFGPDAPGDDEITSAHGCLVAPCLLPVGGRFLDAIVSSNAGLRAVSDSVAAARWCADQGAKVINYSATATTGSTAWTDMLQYLLDRSVQFFASMGNDGVNVAYFPAAYSTTYANCHSSISFDETTGARSTFSNYTATASGCAPGTNILGLTPAGAVTTTSGTSFSSPHMARLCAMGATGGKFTPAQVGAALKANCRDTGQPAAEQGGGAYSLEAALTALGAFVTPSTMSVIAGPDVQVAAVPAGDPTVASLAGTTIGAAAAVSWTAPTPAGIYRLRYTAYGANTTILASDDVNVEVTTNASIPLGTPIVIQPDTIVSTEAFGLPTLLQAFTTLPLVPTWPGAQTFPGPTTFPGGSLDARYKPPRTGWMTYPGPTTYPGETTWPGFGIPGGLPPFDVQLFLLDDGGSYRCTLPDVKAFSLNDVANSAGSVSIDYPVGGTNFDQLAEHVDQGVDATIAVRFAGSAEWELQAILSECDGDDVAEGAVWQFRGAWSGTLLDESVLYPDPGSTDGKVSFVDATPGAILTELAARAQDRGGFDVDTSTFSDAYDSHGQQWPPDSIASPTFAPGDSATLLRIVGLLADAGLVELEMRGRQMRIYPRGGRGWDRTIGTPVILQGGRDLLEASRRHNVRAAVTSLLVLGADGDWVEAVDDTALGRRRRRVEAATSQGSLSGGSLRAYARAKLATATSAAVERVHKLAVVDDSPLPMRDFQVGDWVWSDSDGTRRRLRVAQWTLTLDDQGLSGSVSLGDLIDDPLLKLARKVLGIGDGSTVVGGVGPTSRSDQLVPAAPGNVQVSSVTFPQADGSSISTLLLTWDPVVVAQDGVTGVTVDGYRIRWRYPTGISGGGVGLARDWVLIDNLDATTTAQIEGVEPDTQVEVQVGAYSFNTVTPQPPQTPDPTPTTGGTGGGGVTAAPWGTTIAQILRLGTANGLTKVNLGVDFLPGDGPSGSVGQHKDYTLAEIVAGLDSKAAPKYAQVRPDNGGIVRLTSYVGAATTPNSTHSRTEFRELGPDGIAHAAWSSKSGRHYIYCVGAVIKLPKGRQRCCIAQVHGPTDDLGMVLVDAGVNVESTYGNTGRPGRLTSTLELGRVYQWGIELVREGSQTLIHYYWDDPNTPKATQTYAGSDSLYFKAGDYQQSDTARDSVGETCIIDWYDLEIWHSGYPLPTPRRPWTAGVGVGTAPPVIPPTTATQTLGVGGIPTPAAGPGVVLITSDSSSQLKITQSNVVVDGGGHTVAGISMVCNGSTVQNFVIRNADGSGIYSNGTGNTVQNCDVAQVKAGDSAAPNQGDINGQTFFGDNFRLLYCTIGKNDYLAKRPVGGSHTDGVQTWASGGVHTSSSNVLIKGCWFEGPDSSDDRYLHQGVQVEGPKSTDGGGGGSGDSTNWKVIGNYFKTYGNQCLNFLGVKGPIAITKNTFAGSASHVVGTGDGTGTINYYSDNVVTGSYGSIGASVISGSGPDS